MKHARILSLVLSLVLLLALGTGLYLNDYYRAQEDALVIYENAPHNGRRTLFLPQEATDTGIVFYPGGNHAFFGSYGDQKGDGQATISQDWQQARTARAILQFIRGTTGAQLELILSNRDTWKALDETDGWCYAVTDLDGNGRLEILSSETHGSGHFTPFRAWEISDDYRN